MKLFAATARNLLAACLGFLLAVVAANAQQVTSVLGSPSATTTIDGKQLPPPPPKSGGVIKEGAKDSTLWWPPRVLLPRARPTCC